MNENSLSEQIKLIKHDFMTFRNGIVSETFRKVNSPYKIIFGLQLPQINLIASKFEKDKTLAMELWHDSSVRESRLLACYLIPVDRLEKDEALELIKTIQTKEEADILCFRVLRNLNYADDLVSLLKNKEEALLKYCGDALERHVNAIRNNLRN